MNPKIEAVKFYFSAFELENNYDFVRFYHHLGSTSYTGSPSPGWWTADFTVKHDANKNYSLIDNRFETDHSITADGWRITNLRYRCYQTPPTNPQNILLLLPNKQYDGVLIGTDDTIFFKVTQYGWTELWVHLYAVDAPQADFDIYASTTNTKPSYADYDWKGNREMLPEMFKIPFPDHSRTVYFSVYSYQGSGHFRLYMNKVAVTGVPRQINVTTNFSPTNQQKTVMKDLLLKLSESIYQATDGQIFVDRYDIYWNAAGTLNDPFIQFVYQEASPTAHCTAAPGGHVTLWSNLWTPPQGKPYEDHLREAARIMSHEFMHCWPGLDDDYRIHVDHADMTCGHSIMSGWNQCGLTNIEDICTDVNGGRDSDTGNGHMNCLTDADCSPWITTECKIQTPYRYCGHRTTNYAYGWDTLKSTYSTWIDEVTNTPDPEKFWTYKANDDDPFIYYIMFAEH